MKPQYPAYRDVKIVRIEIVILTDDFVLIRILTNY